jgi:hypothetical protein
MWEADEAAVRKYFDEKKGTVVRLAERGSDLPGMEFTDRDPREEMRELAEKRASEKGIDFNVALTQVKGEKPELVERIASMYGPPTR